MRKNQKWILKKGEKKGFFFETKWMLHGWKKKDKKLKITAVKNEKIIV